MSNSHFKDAAQEAVDELFAEGKIATRPEVKDVHEVAVNRFQLVFVSLELSLLTIRLLPGTPFKTLVREEVLRSLKPNLNS